MISKKKMDDFVARSYEIACAHGFHDEKLSLGHMMMLVVSEIGEMVEADRENRHANLAGFDKCIGIEPKQRFRDYVKDSVEDEMADVCIRLFDLCGTLGVALPEDTFNYGLLGNVFLRLFAPCSFCEKCYCLVSILGHCENQSLEDDGTDYCVPNVIGAALCFIFLMADDMDVDLERHIELKMSYNESRPRKHGKRY